MYNLAIIGGGPAGYTAAEKAAKAGLSVVLFEKEALGGTCLNVGCIPTKTLLYSAKLYHNATHSDRYGIMAENVSFDFAKMQKRKTIIVRKLVAGIKAKLQDCTIVTGAAEVTDYSPERIIITCSEEQYEAEKLLICTGSSNFVPPIPGLTYNPNIWSSTDALAATELPESVAIIGGGVIGMEFATLYMELGIKVAVIEALPSILPNIDSDLVNYLKTKYEKAGITFLTDTRVTEIRGNEIVYSSPKIGEVVEDRRGMITADKILVCVGRRPNLAGLQALPLELERNAVKVNDNMQTNLPNVYAAGDVTGKIMLAHVASHQAEIAVEHMLTGKPGAEAPVPSVVYTNPEIASVSAPNIAKQSEILSLPMTFSGRFMAENEGETGLCKMVVGAETNRILAVHMIGNPASEFIAAATMAIQAEMTPEQLAAIIFPHPTVSEILKEISSQNPS